MESDESDFNEDTDMEDDDSLSEYKPEETDESESENEESESEKEEAQDKFVDRELETASRREHSKHIFEKSSVGVSQDHKKQVNVLPTKSNKNKRVWDKRHCCVFCMKLVAKLPRHLEQMHKNEIEVAKALSYPKRSSERCKLLEELRRKGDFCHNTEVLKKENGILIPCRRPNGGAQEQPSDFIPCDQCLGFFRAKDLWRHKKKCLPSQNKIEKDNKPLPRRGTHQATSAALLPVSDGASDQLRSQILSTMANDEVSMVARSDSLILKFGAKLFLRNGHQTNQHQYIKQKMRELARFLITVRKINHSIWSVSDCINPTMFNDVIKAVKEQCQYEPECGKYKIPSLALKLGHSLKKCSKYLKSTALMTQDVELRSRSDDFLELIENECSCQVSSQALATFHVNSFNKPKRIPLANDIRKLNLFLQEKAQTYSTALRKDPSEVNYQMLAHITQAQLVLFNRRRGGEVERIKLREYLEGMKMSDQPMQEEIMASLSAFERNLANALSRIEIQGKRGRKVPVLISKLIKEQLDLLVHNRKAASISDDSVFLFSRAGQCKTPDRSCDAISKFASECGADKPKLLQSTTLRFHVATVSQILNLKENELDILAGFMGHDIRVHRKFYHLPEDTLQLAKVSKILLQMERGEIEKFKGKALDELEVNDEDTVSDDDIYESEEDNPKATTSYAAYPGYKNPPLKSTSTCSVKGRKTAWTNAEKSAIRRQLAKFVRLRKTPGKRDCENAKEKEPTLDKRPWTQIKYCIKNINSSKKAREEFLESISE